MTEAFSSVPGNTQGTAMDQGAAGPIQALWPRMTEDAGRLCEAGATLLVARSGDGRWKRVTAWRDPSSPLPGSALEPAETLADTCIDTGSALRRHTGEDGMGEPSVWLLGARLLMPGANQEACLLAAGHYVSEDMASTALHRLQCATEMARVPALQHLLDRARTEVERLAGVMDLTAQLNASRKFMRGAMTLCNELAGRLHADRAALGWARKGYVRLRAISHMERFEPKMAAVQALETVMEEAFEQNSEILWPAPGEAPYIARDHGQFAAAEGSVYILSAPLRSGDACIGVVTLERCAAPFTADEVAWLRLCLDQAARLMHDLEARDGWFGTRAWRGLRALAARAMGVEHTGAKMLALAGAAALLFLLFGRWPYRIEAPFTLRTDHAAVLPAPFDGFIELVAVDKGAEVVSGALLLSLDTGDLLLEEAAVQADLTRYQREVEKARAEDALAEMRMATAQVDQALARLELVSRRIRRAELRAPFDGIIVEGDLKERVGAAVRQGDPLMKVARPETLYAELRVGEAGIAHVRSGATARLAFAGRPGEPYPMQVVQVAPMAQLYEGANVFIVRCRRDATPEDWWRPGMSGVARIEGGQRSPVWILTHRTTDFLRLKFGW